MAMKPWRSEILITVPTGHSYEFQFGDVLQSAAKTIENQEGKIRTARRFPAWRADCLPKHINCFTRRPRRMVVRNLFYRSDR